MARTIAIWVFGLLASAIIGSLVGTLAETFDKSLEAARTGATLIFGRDWGIWGALGGVSVFACLRLWLAKAKD